MVNRYRGDVALHVGDQVYVLRLTLGALAELEEALVCEGLLALVERFEGGAFSSRDIFALLGAGLRGGGFVGDVASVLNGEIAGGAVGAAKVAAQLLARAFSTDDGAV